eukprot:2102949-Rhodomonas_salina.1
MATIVSQIEVPSPIRLRCATRSPRMNRQSTLCYAMSGTELAYGAMRSFGTELRMKCGTALAHDATHSAVNRACWDRYNDNMLVEELGNRYPPYLAAYLACLGNYAMPGTEKQCEGTWY